MLAVMPETGRAIDGVLASDYADLRRTLLASLRRRVDDAAAAEDLVQEVMVKAMAARSTASSLPENVGAWLMTIARHALVDHLRARRPTEPLPEDLLADDGPAADEDLLRCLRPMAERLPAPYRDAVIAAEFDGVALATLAQRDQVSLSAIKSRTSRGRVMLRDELVKCCQVTLDAASPGLEYDERKLRACAGDAATPAGSDAIQPPAPSRITPR